MSSFRDRCIGRTSLVGTFAAIPHPVAIEVTAQAGLDFICIDWEHAQISPRHDRESGAGRDVHQVPAMVRVPGHGAEAIAAALDSGARGVLVPRVSTAAQAAAAVKAARYPPLGARGVGPGRAAGYGYRIPEYLAGANAEIVVAVQVETAEGLDNVDAIAATEGVDVVFVGPGDLSVSIDAIGPARRRPACAARSRRSSPPALAHGKAAGIFCATPEDVGKWSAAGASFFILASDTMFLGAEAAAPMQRRHARRQHRARARSLAQPDDFLSLKLLP